MLGHPEGRSVAEEPRSGLTRRNALTLGTTSCGLSRVLFAIYARFHAAVNKAETIEGLLPHLRQFVRVRQALVNAGALGASMAEQLANVWTGVIHLDRRARVVAANDRGGAILRSRDGLTDRDGTLRATLPEEDAALQGLLAQALPYLGGPGAGGSMMVRRENSVSRLVVHVSPVNERGPELWQGRVGALVLAVDPTDRLGIDPERVGDILGLTPAQTYLAVSLAEGRTIREIAAEMGRSVNTVRWHVRHIYTRHGLSRQVELIRLVMSLANIPEVRR